MNEKTFKNEKENIETRQSSSLIDDHIALKDSSIKKNKPIFLLGFMGSGKTYIGKLLAEKLLYDFIDTDALLEKRTGNTIAEIFEKKGEDYFRKLEHNILSELKIVSNCIISIGGGTPCFYENMELINAYGTTIYLKAQSEIIVGRISAQSSHRPLLRNFDNDTDLLIFVKNKIVEREKYYLKAHFIIDANGDVEEIIKNIVSLVG